MYFFLFARNPNVTAIDVSSFVNIIYLPVTEFVFFSKGEKMLFYAVFPRVYYFFKTYYFYCVFRVWDGKKLDIKMKTVEMKTLRWTCGPLERTRLGTIVLEGV